MGWKKGQSGNPSGRPKRFAEFRKSEEAVRLRDMAYSVLVAACDPENEVEWRDRITAARELLDRTEGKPVQAITGEDGKISIGVIVLPTEEE